MKKLKGTFTALVTPFKDGKIDLNSIEKMVRFQIENGITGFVINGTTGESPTLKDFEKKEIFRKVRSIVGAEFPLIMGTGSNNTEKTIEESVEAKSLGADAVLVVVPYYNKPPQRGLYEHFKTLAEKVDIPILLYNVPGRTITSLTTDTIQKLSKVHGIIGIKEASGNIDFAREIATACGEEFILLSGDDGSYVEFLNANGNGVISVASHIIPRQMVNWLEWVKSGNLERAREDINKYSKLIDLLFVEANPIPVKKALQLMGLIETAEMRLPLVELEKENIERLRQEMVRTGVLK